MTSWASCGNLFRRPTVEYATPSFEPEGVVFIGSCEGAFFYCSELEASGLSHLT